MDISNVSSPLAEPLLVQPSVSILYVSLVHVDDVFDIGWFNLTAAGDSPTTLAGNFAAIRATPLPAAVWLFGMALIGLARLTLRRSSGSTADNSRVIASGTNQALTQYKA